MGEKKNRRSTDSSCRKPEGHGEHMCLLMEKGKTAEVARRASNPAFVCQNCGARANQKEDVCNPEPL